MIEKFWKAALAIGGLATVGAFLFWSLYNQWLALPIFSTLSQAQTFSIMLVFLLLSFMAYAILVIAYFRTPESKTRMNASGGTGGSATARNGGVAMGGAGGVGGIGPGGAGGNASAEGEGSFSLGGEGGEGAQPDRPSRGGRSPFEVLGVGDKVIPGLGRLGDFGRGGDGTFGDTPGQPGGPGLVIIEYLGPGQNDSQPTAQKKTGKS